MAPTAEPASADLSPEALGRFVVEYGSYAQCLHVQNNRTLAPDPSGRMARAKRDVVSPKCIYNFEWQQG